MQGNSCCLFWETTEINTADKNMEFLNIKPGVTQNNHWGFKGLIKPGITHTHHLEVLETVRQCYCWLVNTTHKQQNSAWKFYEYYSDAKFETPIMSVSLQPCPFTHLLRQKRQYLSDNGVETLRDLRLKQTTKSLYICRLNKPRLSHKIMTHNTLKYKFTYLFDFLNGYLQ